MVKDGKLIYKMNERFKARMELEQLLNISSKEADEILDNIKINYEPLGTS